MDPAGGGLGPSPTTLPAAVLPQDSFPLAGPWPALASSRGPPSGPGAPVSAQPEPSADGDANCTAAAPAGKAIRPAPSSGPSASTSLPAQGGLSFAQALLRSSSPPTLPLVTHDPAVTDLGEPAAFFTLEEIKISCSPLDFSVIARTPQGRPPFPEIRAHLMQRFKFSLDFFISALDSRHLLIRFQNRADYLLVLLKNAMYVLGKPFFFFKWTMDFMPDKDCPVVPVWIELPGLPANFYNAAMISSLAGSVGSVLQIDRSTVHLMRTHAARANVQMDVSKQMPDRIWVGIGGGGYWQPIMYPDPPKFCKGCHRLGHLLATCKKTTARPAQGTGGVGPDQSAPKAPPTNLTGMRPTERGEWRPVLSKDVTPANLGNQQRPLAAQGTAPGPAHHLFDEMPTQPPPPQMAMGSASGVQEGGPHLPPGVHFTDDGHPTPQCTARGPASQGGAGRLQERSSTQAARQLFDELPPQPQAPSLQTNSMPSDAGSCSLARGNIHISGMIIQGPPNDVMPHLEQQPAAAVSSDDTGTTHYLLDEMPAQQSLPQKVTGPASGAQEEAPHLEVHVTPSSTAHGPAQISHAQQPTPVMAPMAAAPSTPLNQALKASAIAPLHDSGYGTPLQLGIHQNAPMSDIAAPMKPKPTAAAVGISARQMFDESSQPGQHAVQVATEAGNPSVTPEMPQSSNPEVATQQGSKSSNLNPNSPIWQSARGHNPDTHTVAAKADHLLDDPNQFARFLEGSPMEVTPAPLAAKCLESSPTTSRLSFAEALRKKTKKSGPWPPPPGPPPAMAARPASFQPAAPIPGHHGAYMINLPSMFNIRSAPGLEPPGELTSQQLNTLHVDFAGRPRTRSTTIRAPDSDEDYEDRSD